VTDLQDTASVELLDQVGAVLAAVPATCKSDQLHLAQQTEHVISCASMRLLDAAGNVLAALPVTKG
jgi:hypothetical protein